MVPDNLIGTAYGITTAIQNIGLTLFPIIIAALYGWLGRYAKVEPFFACLGIVGVFVAILLNIWDAKNGRILNSPNRDDDKGEEDLTQGLLTSASNNISVSP